MPILYLLVSWTKLWDSGEGQWGLEGCPVTSKFLSL